MGQFPRQELSPVLDHPFFLNGKSLSGKLTQTILCLNSGDLSKIIRFI